MWFVIVLINKHDDDDDNDDDDDDDDYYYYFFAPASTKPQAKNKAIMVGYGSHSDLNVHVK